MARRGTRITRKSGTTVEGGVFRTYPSGTTITKNLVQSGSSGTFKGIALKPSGTTIHKLGINFGQGIYRLYRGTEPLGNKAATSGISLAHSGGSLSVKTGLTSVLGFWVTFQGKSGVTAGHPNMADAYSTEHSTSAGGVTIYAISTNSPLGFPAGVTRNTTLATGGISVQWMAIGTM